MRHKEIQNKICITAFFAVLLGALVIWLMSGCATICKDWAKKHYPPTPAEIITVYETVVTTVTVTEIEYRVVYVTHTVTIEIPVCPQLPYGPTWYWIDQSSAPPRIIFMEPYDHTMFYRGYFTEEPKLFRWDEYWGIYFPTNTLNMDWSRQ